MFTVVIVPEGNAPEIEFFKTQVEAELAFYKVNLDKYVTSVHLYGDEKSVYGDTSRLMSKWYTDGETYLT